MELYPKKNLIKEEHIVALNKMAEVEWEWVFDNTDAHHNQLARTSVNCKLSFSGGRGHKVPLLRITYPGNISERTLIRFSTEKIKYPLSETTWARLMDGYDLFLKQKEENGKLN